MHFIFIGISTLSLLLESVRLAILWAYNYCFGYSLFTYLEYPFLLLQQMVLFHLVAKYRNSATLQSTAINLSIALGILLFAYGALPKWILGYMLVCFKNYDAFCILFHLQTQILFHHTFCVVDNVGRMPGNGHCQPIHAIASNTPKQTGR